MDKDFLDLKGKITIGYCRIYASTRLVFDIRAVVHVFECQVVVDFE